jgi:hypothetical protein
MYITPLDILKNKKDYMHYSLRILSRTREIYISLLRVKLYIHPSREAICIKPIHLMDDARYSASNDHVKQYLDKIHDLAMIVSRRGVIL